mgnify:CR=1 FL=1
MRTETNTLAFTRVPCQQAELITLVKQSKAEQVTSWPTSTTPPYTSKRPTEPINGSLKHLCSSTLRYRNLSPYIIRTLVEIGRFKPQLCPIMKNPIGGHNND